MTYTAEDIKEIVQENIRLIKEVETLKDKLKTAEAERDCAEKKFNDTAVRMLNMSVTESGIKDTTEITVDIPRCIDPQYLPDVLSRMIVNELGKSILSEYIDTIHK